MSKNAFFHMQKKHQRPISICASLQSDQHPCCSILRQYISSSLRFCQYKALASLCFRVNWFVSDLVKTSQIIISILEPCFPLSRVGLRTAFLMSKWCFEMIIQTFILKINILQYFPVLINQQNASSLTVFFLCHFFKLNLFALILFLVPA